MSTVDIRPARDEDVRAIMDITDHYIRNSTCIMMEKDEIVEERCKKLEDHGDRYPTFVAA